MGKNKKHQQQSQNIQIVEEIVPMTLTPPSTFQQIDSEMTETILEIQIQTEPVPEMSESVSEIQTEPVPEMSEPVSQIQTEPVPEIQTEPVPEIQTEPVSQIQTEPVSQIQAEPVPEMSEPVSQIQTEPVLESVKPTEPIQENHEIQTEPVLESVESTTESVVESIKSTGPGESNLIEVAISDEAPKNVSVGVRENIVDNLDEVKRWIKVNTVPVAAQNKQTFACSIS